PHLPGPPADRQLDRLASVDPREVGVALAGMLVPGDVRRPEHAERVREALRPEHEADRFVERDRPLAAGIGYRAAREPHLAGRAPEPPADRLHDLPLEL